MLKKTQIKSFRKALRGHTKDVSVLFSALSDENRLCIVKILSKRNDICVSDLADILGITTAGASQHLKILEQSGLVTRLRKGQSVCYQINKKDPRVRPMITFIKTYCCALCRKSIRNARLLPE